MPIYFKKSQTEILSEALDKIKAKTPINSTSPGSVVRAITEVITKELGAYYDILDFNLSQSLLSSASGGALDNLGKLYGVTRKTVGSVAAANQKVGSFYFDIIIPAGTSVFTDTAGYIGRQLAFLTNNSVTIPAGSLRGYVGLKPDFADSIFTAGENTLTAHNYVSPVNVVVKCVNPKAVTVTQGYELDADYRARLIKAVRVASSGTLEAVRFAGLSVSGVRDIKIRQAPYGLGSFEVMVVSEQPKLSDTVSIAVRTVVDQVRPVGSKMFFTTPKLRPLDVTVNVMAPNNGSPEYDNLRQRVENAIIRYLNDLLPGDAIVFNKMIQNILDSSGIITDVQVVKFAPNGVDAIRRNYTPKEDEQIIPGKIIVTVS